MVISNEMYHKIINSKEKMLIINDDYVLLHKKMPCKDSELDNYIESLNKLSNEGVNVSNIVDYKLIDGTTSSYSNGVSYTTGVFLEKRAKGNCIADVKKISLKTDKVYDFKIVSYMFYKLMDYYVSELEKRAFASQEQVDKLIDDYLSFNKYGLEPDPKPLNFFYEENVGYTIIDVIPSKRESVDKNYFARYISGIIFGYDFPKIYIDYDSLNIITNEYKDRLDKLLPLLEEKIINALIKVGIDKENILEALVSFRNKYSILSPINGNLENYIENVFYSKKKFIINSEEKKKYL